MVPGWHDRRSAVMATLSALVSGLEAELGRLGYKDSTMVWYRGCWRRLQKHFAARGVEEFSLDASMAWVDEACGFFAKEQAGTLKRTDVYLFRVAQMLEDYAVHGAVLRRYNRSVSKLDGPGAEAVARFQAHLRSAGRSVSTVRAYGTLAGEFVAFTGTRGGLACCDAARIVAAIDRDNPCGKRDYAIILLITRLGLRGVDIRQLEFADFDWPGNRLLVTQAKTSHRVALPLLKEVGWAVIDYIRHGRPDCDCPQVFVRHTAPIGPFSDQDHLHQILVKHARVAHVRVSEQRRHGMHSLRHSLATRLMEGGTPVEQIADILGHQSVQSTGVYLKSSLGLLAKCALDPDAPANGVSR